MANEKDPKADAAAKEPDADQQPKPAKTKQVRVIHKGPLGPKLLMKGDVTDDPDYVAVLEKKGQKKVELVSN